MDNIHVPVLQIDTPTKDNVVYPLKVVQAAVVKASNKKFVCQLMMPSSMKFGPSVMVDASHVVESLYIKDDTLYAELRVLDTMYGKMLQELSAKVAVKFGCFATADAHHRADGMLEVTNLTICGVHVTK